MNFVAQPEGPVDHFHFPAELTIEALKATIRGFGARVLRPDEVDPDLD